MYMSSPNRDRLHRNRTTSRKIPVLMVLSFLSITITTLVFPPFDQIQVPLAYAQQETNNNNSSNIKLWVVDSGNNRIQEFNQDGKFINTCGPLGISTSGHLHNSVDFDLGLTGKGYLIDHDNSRIQVLATSPTKQR
jgi:hypothetical protein